MPLSFGERERRRWLQNLRAQPAEEREAERVEWEAEAAALASSEALPAPEHDADPLLRERSAYMDGAWNE